MTPEGKVKADVKKFLKSIGCWYFLPVSNGMGQVGIPDFICCFQGRFVAIETKAPGKLSNTTANQDRVISEIKLAGGSAVVVDNVEQVKAYFNYHFGVTP
jgi:hypothetical protein